MIIQIYWHMCFDSKFKNYYRCSSQKWSMVNHRRLYSIKWQKRGLPHCHLLWLIAQHRITPDKIDNILCAEIPNPTVDLELHQIVMSNMVHGPCGSVNLQSPCMQDGLCSKQYLEPYMSKSRLGSDGCPLYKKSSLDDGKYHYHEGI